MFETIPSSLADQIAVDLSGTETKDETLVKTKAAVVKKCSIFLYCKDFHELSQSRGEDPSALLLGLSRRPPPVNSQQTGAQRITVLTL